MRSLLGLKIVLTSVVSANEKWLVFQLSKSVNKSTHFLCSGGNRRPVVFLFLALWLSSSLLPPSGCDMATAVVSVME